MIVRYCWNLFDKKCDSKLKNTPFMIVRYCWKLLDKKGDSKLKKKM